MHELYEEFAKAYLGNENEGLFRFGVCDGDLHLPSLEDPGWATVPRIHLGRLSNVAKVKEWRNVAVVHLIGCETITTFSIGELMSLRDLAIVDCQKLEVLSWTQEDMIVTKQLWGTKLCYVDLVSNKSLRTLPDFSTCSELRMIYVEECSSSVEHLRLHNCSNLKVLCLRGNDVPEVQTLESCPELRVLRLKWKATHKDLPLLDNLPCLSDLEVQGSSDVPLGDMHSFSSWLGKNQFCKQHPKDSVCHDLLGVGMPTNKERVHLTCTPLGKLPVQQGTVGSSLQSLDLTGCLLSSSVDFSAFPNLHDLTIVWTNVEEVWSLEHLKKLRSLDCSHCFQLQKVPDLRPLSELERVFFVQCPYLLGIPRLPPGCIRNLRYEDSEDSDDSDDSRSEDMCRVLHAVLAFAKLPAKPLPSPRFAIASAARERVSGGITSQYDGGLAIHATVTCDGCRMFPLAGPRYMLKSVRVWYSLCSNCFSDKYRRN